jgi:hypothetical protein
VERTMAEDWAEEESSLQEHALRHLHGKPSSLMADGVNIYNTCTGCGFCGWATGWCGTL